MVGLVHYNLTALLGCWRSRASGTLRLTPTALHGPVNHLVPVVDGGIVDEDVWSVLLESMETHAFSLIEHPPRVAELEGNRRLMAALIKRAARRYKVNEGAILEAERLREDRGTIQQLQLLPPVTLPPFLLWSGPEEREDSGHAEELRERGRALLVAGQFARADAVLSEARDLRMDHPQTLALLSMARASNTERPRDERRRDAEAMAKMAWLLAPEDADVIRACEVVLESEAAVEDEPPRRVGSAPSLRG